jgi:phosphohistidine swiveling domain-containing protein
LKIDAEMTLKVQFGSKAGTLRALAAVLTSAQVLPVFVFSVGEWQRDRDAVLQLIEKLSWSSAGPLVVRSSAMGEDSHTQSLAGQFSSVLNVNGRAHIIQSVAEVVESYGRLHDDDEVLIQPEVVDALYSGVACSCDPSTAAPYRVISWHEGTDTTKVTMGNADDVENWVGVPFRKPVALPDPLKPLLALLDEIEALTGEGRFEVEFAINSKRDTILLQARPLVVSPSTVSPSRHAKALRSLSKGLKQRSDGTSLAGAPIYSSMCDWNPAEMIGEKPRQLAASLYEALITDEAWAASRTSYGYRDMRGTPLMVNFGGLHYIDVRADFYSFTPSAVNEGLVARLSEYYSRKLLASPELHDKVEFEIVTTCNAFGLSDQMAKLRSEGFSEDDVNELHLSLVELTNDVLSGETTWRRDRKLLEESRTLEATDIQSALVSCRDSGGFPFAGLARAGFIGSKLLKGLVERQILSSDDLERLMGSLKSVTQDMLLDFHRLGREEFLSLYGHLRPGTYDICAPSYAEDPERYFGQDAGGDLPSSTKGAFSLTDPQRDAIALLMAQDHIAGTPDVLIEFIQSSIRNREWGKFEYSKQVSHLLNLVNNFAEHHGLSREDVSFLPIQSILAGQEMNGNSDEFFSRLIAEKRDDYELTSSILLPSFVTSPNNFFDFLVPNIDPNYVTKKRVIGRVADVDRGDDVKGAIALISSADPGFDWLFTTGIVGLITAYGGVNSHMAIRAQELGIPTVTGVGPNRFASYRNAHSIELDCAAGFVRVTR